MSCLNRQDAPSGGQDVLVHDLLGRAQVRRRADSLEDIRRRNELHNTGDTESIRALQRRRHAQRLQRRGQERNVSGLVRADGLDIGVKGGVETRRGELGLGEVGEALAIEFIFEVFQSESIPEDVD